MGKGGTKFEGAAIGNRQSRGGGAVSGKEARKAMDTFKKTGKHPHLGGRDGEAADLAHAAELNVFDDAGKLPPRNAKRPHAFMSVQTAPDSVVHMQFELFDDINPLAARSFRLLCAGTEEDGLTTGSCYRGLPFHKVLPNQCVEGGNMELGKKSVPHLEQREKAGGRLGHACAGVVSLSPEGTGFTISLAPASHLDFSRIVVGRIVGGHLAVTTIGEALQANVKNEKLPVPFVEDCGALGSSGVSDAALVALYESRKSANEAALAQAMARRDETPQHMAERLREESAKRKDSIREVLQEGLSEASKRQKMASAGGPKSRTWDTLGSDDSESSEEEEAG